MNYSENTGAHNQEQGEEVLVPETEREETLAKQARLEGARAMAFAFVDRFRNRLAEAHGNAELLRPDGPDAPGTKRIETLQASLEEASKIISDATNIQQIVYAKTPQGVPRRLDLEASVQPPTPPAGSGSDIE